MPRYRCVDEGSNRSSGPAQVAIVNVRVNAYNWLQARTHGSTMVPVHRSPMVRTKFNKPATLIEAKKRIAMNSTPHIGNEANRVNSLPIAAMNGGELNDHAVPGSGIANVAGSCCGIGGCSLHRAMWGMTAAIVFLGTVALGCLVWFTQQSSPRNASSWTFPAVVDATAAVSSEKYSVATGLVGDSEAFFVLDHNSGLLQCTVMYARLGKFNARFSINVNDALGAGSKGGQFVMVTGQADFPASSNNPVASTVVYVLNTATGNYSAYGVPFDRTALTAGRPQQGAMFLLGAGQANPVVDRDALR